MARLEYAASRTGLEARDSTKAASFVERYKIWLAVHSFFLYRDQQAAAKGDMLEPQNEPKIAAAENREREERCRIAAISALFAAREVSQMGMSLEDTEA